MYSLKKISMLLLIFLILLFLSYNIKQDIPANFITIESVNNNDDIIRRIELYKIKYKIRNIIVYILYGRKIYTEILFRYLDRNLKINGGIIDKIILSNHLMGSKVNKQEELLFLNNYLKKHKKGYEVVQSSDSISFKNLYSVLHEDDSVFKIDDDIVFIANGTFERMVDEYFKNDHFILSANVINHFPLSALHAKMNLMLPFYELTNHTWIKDNRKDNRLLVKCKNNVDAWRFVDKCGAIAHESFLYNIYKNDFNLDIYNFTLYDLNYYNYARWRINFILFRGSFVNKIETLYKKHSSEEIITQLLPRDMKRHSYVLGSAIAAHFSYSGYQVQYLKKTNIVKKYDKLSFDYLKIKVK
jgi:hypothetical protein